MGNFRLKMKKINIYSERNWKVCFTKVSFIFEKSWRILKVLLYCQILFLLWQVSKCLRQKFWLGILCVLVSNKVCVIRDILKSNKITHDLRHFVGKISGISGWRGCRGNFYWMLSFQTIQNSLEGSYVFGKINRFDGWN